MEVSVGLSREDWLEIKIWESLATKSWIRRICKVKKQKVQETDPWRPFIPRRQRKRSKHGK